MVSANNIDNPTSDVSSRQRLQNLAQKIRLAFVKAGYPFAARASVECLCC